MFVSKILAFIVTSLERFPLIVKSKEEFTTEFWLLPIVKPLVMFPLVSNSLKKSVLFLFLLLVKL
jgi:hypothetical protein